MSTSGPSVPQPQRATRRYPCSYPECSKSYSKLSRLSEHYRSHTGERPFVCDDCGKSYLRETHLHAHRRSHLPDSQRSYVCTESPGCGKRFWTLQHLRVHQDTHRGEKAYTCPEDGCEEAFSKHHQLRAHVCQAHSPPGTKPYICSHPSCDKSFSTNQKLRGHMKTHDDKRYTCSHPSCAPDLNCDPVYFGTWTALQSHMRTAHPPTCTHESCEGQTFASAHNLRAHLKLHEQREVEALLQGEHVDDNDGETSHSRRRRRGGELGRDWKCDYANCEKEFKSKRALTAHHKVIHIGQRNHVCPHPLCDSAFGYKHLLQRHLAKIHSSKRARSSSSSADDATDAEASEATTGMDVIEEITGKAYARRLQNAGFIRCPFPDVAELYLVPSDPSGPSTSSRKACDHVVTRAYDLRRHLKAEHGVVVDKAKVDQWISAQKRTQTS
ncbi:hypothetical protein EDD16DRAFT_1821162 [Pisolithus croceorrhizus]|nr:hypothetical protein EV401DRAFT_1850576 [Pisolithus croceorrhizus]KAI6132424.1 hypothetical protein EDD16DRAFT_1821162 [Pisolithus croceorrhizus]KAI6168747.1 hypothetical protein EDD17DRAFT_1466181 [Pisolithus thermaeus]